MTKRLSVTLESEDDELVAAFASEASSEHASLRVWAERRGHVVGHSLSEAALLRLLIRAGAEALRESSLDVGYARLAVEIDQENRVESRVARERFIRRSESREGQ